MIYDSQISDSEGNIIKVQGSSIYTTISNVRISNTVAIEKTLIDCLNS